MPRNNNNNSIPTPDILIGVKTDVGVQFRSYAGALTAGRSVPDNKTALIPAHLDVNLVFNADGSLVAITTSTGVTVRDTNTEQDVCTITSNGIRQLFFSPCSTFLVTHAPKIRGRDIPNQNLIIWSVSSGEPANQFVQPEFRDSQWPTVGWSEDEKLFGRLVAGAVNLYDGKALSTVNTEVKLPGIVQFQFAPGVTPYQLSAFAKPTNNHAGRVVVWRSTDWTTPSVIRTVGAPDDLTFKWSPLANNLLIVPSVEIKAGNYNGADYLHLVSTDPERNPPVAMSFTDKGTVLAAEWGPEGKDFAVIHVQDPKPRTFMYKASDGKAVRHFGQGPYNTLKFSPSGRFLCIAGFANMAGDMVFWDKPRFRQMGVAKMSDATTYEWTPDSRNFITAANRPRRRTSERFIMWTYAGEKVYEETVPMLYQVAVRPAAKNAFPNRPCSPRLKSVTLQDIEKKKPQKYIPPGARRAAAANGGSNFMKQELKGPSKFVSPSGEAKPMTAKEIENQKRRERRARSRAKKAEAKRAAAAAATN